MRRFIVVLILAATGLLVPLAAPAWACSCAQVDPLAQAELAFVGVAESVDGEWEGDDPVEIRFAVESVAKGAAGPRVEITTEAHEPACGYEFTEGHRYRVYANGGATSLCSGNEDLGHAGGAPPADRPSGVLWWGGGLAALIVAGLAFAARRRRGPGRPPGD